MSVLEVNDLRVWFHTRDGVTRAVDGVSFAVERGQTLGIVGESGCGKSVTFYATLGLLPMPPARIESGTAVFRGMDLLRARPAALRAVRGKGVGMIFQDPMTALNPCMKIGRQVMEPLLVHGLCARGEAFDRAAAMLESAGIQDAPQRMTQYPHMFSGGMRQRAVIAMALAAQPDLLVADEPTTALDVTVQAQIMALLARLRAELGMAVVLITHDMGVIAGFCDRVLVMYAGRILESATAGALFKMPTHPYTRALLKSLPGAQTAGKSLHAIPGLPPERGAPERGCPFAPRCPACVPECREADCTLEPCGAPGHSAACLRVQRGERPGDLI
ncbi:MAG TPA: ABC transporter ATP-binding protein [Candidatus Hydrogenedentes bacterium]|jgi:oligopeptide transport system ATP-binding protein|nr:ABC transporter ATP-binding protein [Candidatus Hydrogenedentota bacterium]